MAYVLINLQRNFITRDVKDAINVKIIFMGTTKELNLYQINGSSKYVAINLSFYYLHTYLHRYLWYTTVTFHGRTVCEIIIFYFMMI